MSSSTASDGSGLVHRVRIRADEVDDTGSNVPMAPTPQEERKRASKHSSYESVEPQGNQGVTIRPARPQLRRDQSTPAPQLAPPPASPELIQDGSNTTDSLSLLQLKRLVAEIPVVEPAPYAFKFEDASSFSEEIEEWFTYDAEEQATLLKAQESFSQKWNASNEGNESHDWTAAQDAKRRQFMTLLLRDMEDHSSEMRTSSFEAILYLGLGVWEETASHEIPDYDVGENEQRSKRRRAEGSRSRQALSFVQLDWMVKNVALLSELNGLPVIYEVITAALLQDGEVMPSALRSSGEFLGEVGTRRRERWTAMTLLYVTLEVARRRASEGDFLLSLSIANLQPNLLSSLTDKIAQLRWDENTSIPVHNLLLLTWKTILLSFGGIQDVATAKAALGEPPLADSNDPNGFPSITASPLDYHLFRQEITSKYPAYNPPKPLFALEPDNNSILPPLKSEQGRVVSSMGSVGNVGPASLNSGGASILHQPVHIATPAPSPPPSPAGPGGKGGKKHNYQTNQMFPFLYPSIDDPERSEDAIPDFLTTRVWEGRNIPTSILEAADLFAKRMRATRAMKQLWEERVRFMKYERGWEATDADGSENLSGLLEPALEPTLLKPPLLSHDEDVNRRLEAVEEFYRNALPHMQSLVIVLLKVILTNVTALITQPSGPNGVQNGFQLPEQQNGTSLVNTEASGKPDVAQEKSEPSLDELNTVRSQEIAAKAVSGIILFLLKWFKLSHVLKFEYLTQLLLDTNYIPLVLKLFAHQEPERVVNYIPDREDLSFSHFCLTHSRNGPPETQDLPSEDGDSVEDAVPPPIKLRADEHIQQSQSEPTHEGAPQRQPEADALGYPTSDLPAQPITHFSWRNFFSTISFLRILQKIVKTKAHRNLLLVQYKPSTILKKLLKVPQPELRLYTLKLFKGQVPYCGRKWRQNNMRVITAVWLHCRPELRDEWLAGGDGERDVEEAVPLEMAMRGLTHWWHLRRYPEALGKAREGGDEDMDFFVRELEKMEWGRETEDAGVEEGAEGQGWEGQGGQGEGW